MRKMLIVSDLMDAYPRITNIAYHLPECGWRATVLTPPLPPDFRRRAGLRTDFFQRVRVLEVGKREDIFSSYREILYALGLQRGRNVTDQLKGLAGLRSERSWIDRFLQLYQAVMGFPDTQKGWIGPAVSAASAVGAEGFDLLWSSHPHASVHVIASKVHRRLGLPWVADFRDLWSQNYNYLMPRWRRRIDEAYERRILSAATALTTVSEGFARAQETFLGRRPSVLMNGFDADWLDAPPAAPTKTFSITYCGTIYPGPGRQDVSTFLKPLAELVAEGSIRREDLEVRFVGTDRSWLARPIEDAGLTDRCRLIPRMPRRDLVKLQKESQLLLLLNFRSGFFPLKFFGYLASGRPILATGGSEDDELAEVMRSTNAGSFCPSHESVKKTLADLYADYKATGRVAYAGLRERIERFRYDAIARELGRLCDGLVPRRVHSPSMASAAPRH